MINNGYVPYQNYNFHCDYQPYPLPQPELPLLPHNLSCCPQDTYNTTVAQQQLVYTRSQLGQRSDSEQKSELAQGVDDGVWFADKAGQAGKGLEHLSNAPEHLKNLAKNPTAQKYATKYLGDSFDVLKKADDVGDAMKGLKCLKTAGTVAKFLKPIAIVGDIAQVFTSGVEIYETRKNKNLTASEKDQKVGESVCGGVGNIIGGSVGAAIGGAIGSAIPGPGTIIGGLVGGLVGDWVGGAIGKAIGGTAVGKAVGSVTNAGIDAVFGKSECAPEKKESPTTVSLPPYLVQPSPFGTGDYRMPRVSQPFISIPGEIPFNPAGTGDYRMRNIPRLDLPNFDPSWVLA